MSPYAAASTHALSPAVAAAELAAGVARELPVDEPVVGALVLATAAGGPGAHAIGRQLAAHWPEADLAGTSFEGIVAEGRIWRDRPAIALLAWSEGPGAPMPFCFEEPDPEPETVAHEILTLAECDRLAPDDLVLVFPDALGLVGIEAWLDRLAPLLGAAAIAGAAASGVDAGPAMAWHAQGAYPGGLVGLIVPGAVEPAPDRVRCAGASRSASPWLEITACRSRWIDGLEGEPPLDWVRRQLGLADDAAVEPYLDRLLVRIRRAGAHSAGAASGPATDPESGGSPSDYEERFLVGIDDRRGAFSVPGRFQTGDQLALALPDAALAREALRASVDALPRSRLLLQFACRTRDAVLHGDADLESALVAHRAPERRTLGTVAPYQLGPDGRGRSRMLVHATVLAALGSG